MAFPHQILKDGERLWRQLDPYLFLRRPCPQQALVCRIEAEWWKFVHSVGPYAKSLDRQHVPKQRRGSDVGRFGAVLKVGH